MILEYHRPKTIDQALSLLDRPKPPTYPLGGGTVLSHKNDIDFAVVDLQSLGLNHINQEGTTLRLGATTLLSQLLEDAILPTALKDAIYLDANLNQRNLATLAGSIVSGSGESLLLAVLLAGDARLVWLPGERLSPIGEYLALRSTGNPGKIISEILFSTQSSIRFEYVGRTPMDRILLSVTIAKWPSGRTRVVLGGPATAPILAMDGSDREGVNEAAINACSHLSTQWTSKEYQINSTQVLTKRILNG